MIVLARVAGTRVVQEQALTQTSICMVSDHELIHLHFPLLKGASLGYDTRVEARITTATVPQQVSAADADQEAHKMNEL